MHDARHGSGLGSQRWVVERTLSWLHQHRRLRIRYERQAEIHEAFLSLACSLICLRALQDSFLLEPLSHLFRQLLHFEYPEDGGGAAGPVVESAAGPANDLVRLRAKGVT